ncbi:SDR family oxidoreductase [Polaromonas sp. A23]|uniref:SDR family oxidoreductase n=1 Tax=Polaromonas sp. A23 TaxID=1944133 RepID=UPI000987B9BC|nr:SDR family oxidoreductase [Polaromonas sp. A23]OOG43993.1 short-chain dehydrogenase [Polaromonas sp. A23]
MNPAPAAPVVLVTGAAKRLGREIALALAAGGWRVAVHYRHSAEDAIKTVADCGRLTEGAAHFHSNLEDQASVRALLPQVIKHFGQVDAVVNNASTFEHDNVAGFSFEAMEKHMRSNTGAAIVLAQALHTHVAARQAQGAVAEQTGQFAVINLLDQKLWNQNPDFFSYTLSKAALEAANTMLAIALAPLVRVVGVAPGLTLTSHLLSDEKFQALHKLAPLGRSSSPADVASAVKFALENSSMTGTTLLVDGGQHLMKFERDFSLM